MFFTVRRGDVLSAWSGIRPLVSDPNKEDTQSLARNHIVHVSDSKLVTIAGGKWTTFRAMAEHTIDAAVKGILLLLLCQYLKFPASCKHDRFLYSVAVPCTN
jgi:glycerol-3-phosphate dehydrogenase